MTIRTGLGLFIGSLILGTLGFFVFSGAFQSECVESLNTSQECVDRSLSACCGGIFLMILAIGIGIGGIVSMITGSAQGGERVVIVQQPSSGVIISKPPSHTKSLDEELEELRLD